MELLKIEQATYLEEYKIELIFNDATKGVVDLREKIFTDHRKIFEPLRDFEFFKNFSLNSWTIEWENGLDLAPEFLYNLVTQNSEVV